MVGKHGLGYQKRPFCCEPLAVIARIWRTPQIVLIDAFGAIVTQPDLPLRPSSLLVDYVEHVLALDSALAQLLLNRYRTVMTRVKVEHSCDDIRAARIPRLAVAALLSPQLSQYRIARLRCGRWSAALPPRLSTPKQPRKKAAQETDRAHLQILNSIG